VTGCFYGTVNFAEDWGGSDTKTSARDYDIFITKINVDGTYGWTRRMGGTDGCSAYSICTDAAGNVYVAGYFQSSSVNFAEDWGGSDTKTNAGYWDIFVTKINANGTYGWTRRMGGTSDDVAYSICTDASGNVYVAGRFGGTVNFAEDWGGNDTKTNGGGFVTRINADGRYAWTRRMGGQDIDGVNAICTDEGGNIYVAGAFYETFVNFAEDWSGLDIKVTAGGWDVFITKITANGSYIWTHTMGGIDDDGVSGICADGSGNIYVAGYFQSTVNFAQDWGGSDAKTSAGSLDMFITKIGQ
jgi:hypothetical protein